jgi:altronate hydrolase
MNNNPSPGNKAGGLTTILEKSLGAVAKGGTTNLEAVYEYAEPVDGQGLRLHGHAGLRPGQRHRPGGGRRQPDLLHHRARQRLRLCAIALAQAGHQLGTVAAQEDDMDINCGEIIDGSVGYPRWANASLTGAGHRVGQLSKSERHGYGQNEFVPWQVGAVM